MAVPARFGPEFRVNTTTTGNQDSASVAALANGKFVVVWEDDGSGADRVKRQIYNADGSKFGGAGEVIVADPGAFGVTTQINPVVTGTGDGRFVVAWEEYFSLGGGGEPPIPRIYGRVSNSDGTSPVGVYGNLFQVNTDTTRAQTEPAIAAFTDPANGRFLASFTTQFSPQDTDIYARAYNAAGASSENASPVDASSAKESQSAVAGLANGNYVAVWTDSGQIDHTDGSGSHIRGCIVVTGAGGSVTAGPDFIVNHIANGDQSEPAVAALSDGNFVVVWKTGPIGDRDVVFRLFHANGAPQYFGDSDLGGGVADQSQPSVTATATGFLVAWTDAGSADGSGSHIRAQLFDNSGAEASDEFIVTAAVTIGSQFEPSVAEFADGRIVITWTDPGLDPAQADASGSSVRAQIFDPRTAGLTAPIGTALDDDHVGTGFGDSMLGLFGNDTLAGAAGADTLGGGDGNDLLLGGDGDDQLFGNAHNDNLNGGLGNDILNGGADTDILTGGSGLDTASYAGAAGGVTVSLALAGVQNTRGAGSDTLGGIENLVGSSFNDTLVGNNLANVLSGGLGNDVLNGGAGIDTADFSAAAGPINVDLKLTGAQNTGEGLDVFSGIENLIGSAFGDTLAGDAPNNRIDGAGGNDTLKGNAAHDTLLGDTGNDLLYGEAGNDTLDGGAGIDRLYDGAGNDTVFGGVDADQLFAGPAIDRLDGGAGNDRLYAHAASADTFVFASAVGIDRVFNFLTGIHNLEIDASVYGGAAGFFIFRANPNPVAPSATRALLYDTDDGKLWFDADGNGAGLRVHVLTLFGAPTLAAADIALV